MDWDEVMDVDVESLEGAPADNMFEQLAEFDPGDEDDPGRMRKLFLVTQAIMLVKATQAEVVEEQLDEMAKTEGKKSAKKDREIEDLKRETQQLKRENKDLKLGAESGGGGGSRDTRFLREEMQDMEHQISLLQRELKEKERQLLDERQNTDRFIQRAEDAEKEMRDLKRENEQHLEDVRDYQRQLDAQRDTMLTKRDEDVEYRDKMTQKNKLLNAALEENRILAETNLELDKKLEDMRSRVIEARKEMDKTTDDYIKLKLVVQQSDEMVESLRRENEMLKDQVDDLQEQVKSKVDADDEIMVTVNNKVEEWKAALSEKDEEIFELRGEILKLREQLIAANMDTEKASVTALSKALEERDKKIETLKRRLEDAVGDLETNAALMEDVQSELKKGGKGAAADRTLKRMTNLQSNLQEREELLLEAEKRAQQAEKDAEDKDQALSEALERMRQYEAGEYGLAEAVSEIKDNKLKVNIRDRQIEELTQHINKCELKINDMYDENDDLRERLGLDLQEPLDLTEFRNKKNVRQQEEKAVNRVLQHENEKLEEERIMLKQQLIKLARAAGQRAVALGLDADDVIAVDTFIEDLRDNKKKGGGVIQLPSNIMAEEGVVLQRQVQTDTMKIRNIHLDTELDKKDHKLEEFRKENAELKLKTKTVEEENKQMEKGMREIQQAIVEHNKDGDTVLQSPTLERMLAAIEAKNLVGRYDTSLYLKAQVDNLTGHNEELRAELKTSRYEATKAKVELERSCQKVTSLEGELATLREVGAGVHFQAMPLPEGMAITSSEVIASLNEHLIQVIQEVALKEDMVTKMESALDTYKRKFAVMRHQMGLLYQDHINEKKTLEEAREKLAKELKDVRGAYEEDSVRLQEFDRLVDTLSQDEVEVRRRLADMTRKITVLRVNEKALTRRYNAITEIEGTLRKESNKQKNEMIQMERAVAERLGYLQRYKDMAQFKIAALQKTLDDCAPASELELANKKFAELTEKYRDMLDKTNSLVITNEQSAGFEVEVSRLRDENKSLLTELEVEKEKLHVLEAAFENMRSQGLMSSKELSSSDVTSLSKKLTTLEMKELNERQKAEHANRMYQQQKSQLRHLEDRNMELETKFADLTRMNLEAQKVERELRDDLANCVTKAVSDADRARIMEFERIEANLRNEVAKLKDIAEVATVQSRALDAQQTSRDKEVISLRQQLLDFQAQSDEKTVIGKLHRHIVQMQVSEGTAVRKLEDAHKKITLLEAQNLRLQQRIDDKEQTIYHNRLESRSKVKYLKRTVHDLRRKYAGAVPLPQQEKFAESMVRLQQDKAQIETDLRKTNEERNKVEDKLAELEMKHKGLQELIDTLADGRGAQKVAEWHSKMENLRLEEVRHKRSIDKLKHQIKFLEGVVRRHENEVLSLEEDKVRMAKDFETRELDWEQREMELERIIDNMERTQAEIAGAANQFETAVGALPDPSWPVPKQLDHAVTTIKSNIKIIMDAKGETQVLRKQMEELRKEIKGKDKEVLSRDKVITELRLRLPASAERDALIVKATMKHTETTPGSMEEDPETKQAMRVAQSTVAGLQARIAQKEETLAKYQELLTNARDDMRVMNKRHEEELKHLQEKLHSKSDVAFSKFKEQALQMISKPQASLPTNDQLRRLNELEDVVAEQDNSVAQLRDKLSKSRQELQDWRNKYEDNVKYCAEEKESILGEHAQQVKDLQGQVEDLQGQLEDRDKEIDVLSQELEDQKDANSRAPTTTMKNLVDRLKNQVALKEKQQQALSKALTELRADMVGQAQEQVKANADQNAVQNNVQKVIEKHTKEYQEQLEDLQNQNQKLKRDNKKHRERVETANAEVEEVRQDLAKRESQVKKLKEDKTRMESEVETLEKKIERMSTMTKQKGQLEGIQGEVTELRRKNKQLQEDLRRAKHQPEKPYEQMQQPTKEEKGGPEAVARWEESKKWQKMVDRLKGRIKDKETELEKTTKSAEMLKNALERANRDKENLEHKLRRAQQNMEGVEVKKDVAGVSKSAAPSHSMEELKRQNFDLQEEVAQLKRELTMSRDAAYEEVQIRNKFLMEKLDTMEHQMARRVAAGQDGGVGSQEYRELAQKEQNLQKSIIKLSEENLELKFEVEQSRKDIPRLKGRIEDLQKYVDVLKVEKDQLMSTSRSQGSSLVSMTSSNIRRIGESGKTNRELEKTVGLLKKVVERTQAENEQLKRSMLTPDHLQAIQGENQALKGQMEELRLKMGATLSERYTSHQKGTAKIMSEHDKLRQDLIKEKDLSEKLRIQIRQQDMTIQQVKKDLEEKKTRLEIEEAKRPSTTASMDNKGWKSAVVTRMYEGKLKALEEEVEKKNKVLGDVKVLLHEAAEREQNLIHDNQELQEKVAVLEQLPGGADIETSEMFKGYQLTRLANERLENEKRELLYEIQVLRKRVNPEAGGPTDVKDDEIVTKLRKYDQLMQENVDLRTSMKAAALERDDYKKEVHRLKKELENFGPEFFEEIEDLKYNYREAIEQNVQYEEKLSHISTQFGIDISVA